MKQCWVAEFLDSSYIFQAWHYPRCILKDTFYFSKSTNIVKRRRSFSFFPVLREDMDTLFPRFSGQIALLLTVPPMTVWEVQWQSLPCVVSDFFVKPWTVAPLSSCPQSFPASKSLPMSQFFTSGGQSTGTSASVLPMNTESWFSLRWAGLISLLPRDSQESSPAPHFGGINSLALSLVYGPALTFVHGYWKNHSFDYTDLCMEGMQMNTNKASKVAASSFWTRQCFLLNHRLFSLKSGMKMKQNKTKQQENTT